VARGGEDPSFPAHAGTGRRSRDFFRKAAVEIRFEEKRYLVVPQAAILCW
jgi:hypothetical protein